MQQNLIRSLPLALVAALSLSACSSEPETFNEPYDPQAAELANAAEVAPPPMIKASGSYRCKDNSLIYVDYMTDETTANFRTEKGGAVTVLTAPAAGEAYVSEDGSKTVTGQGDNITYNGMACKTG